MVAETEQTNALAPPSETAEIASLLATERTHHQTLSLPEWYLKVMAECDLIEDRIKEQAQAMIAQVAARRKALEWRWGREFREHVEGDLAAQTGKRKSVKYLTGTAGFRTNHERLVITDAVALENWCSAEFPDGLKLTLSVSKVKEHVKATGEIPPGTELVAKHEKFFPSTENRAITEEVTNAD